MCNLRAEAEEIVAHRAYTSSTSDGMCFLGGTRRG